MQSQKLQKKFFCIKLNRPRKFYKTLDPANRLYFSEGFWWAESEFNLRIAPSRQDFEKS